MTTVQQVLDVAREDLGTVEAPDGATPFHRAYGIASNAPWCAVWVWDVFRRAGASDLIHPKTAYTPTLADFFRAQRRFDTNPQPGDLVFYNWPGDGVDRIQHVGIVEAVEPDAIVALEGNTSPTNQSNGGQVMRRRRARTPAIVGYGHPAYSAPTPPRPPAPALAPPAPEEDIVASLADLERVMNEVLDKRLAPAVEEVVERRLGRVIWETTGGLPNRRGPGGGFLPGGPEAETLWGYVMNTDGAAFRIEQKLDELAGAARAGGIAPDALARALAPALAPLIAQQLAAGFAAAAARRPA